MARPLRHSIEHFSPTKMTSLRWSTSIVPSVGPNPSIKGTPAMNELLCIARLKIHHGKLDEFKHLAARCVELVCTKDTRTLQCELYFNSDNTECLVFERYRDSQALLDHHKNPETLWPGFSGHALGLEKYAERLARN
jgi:quinol monooxygenase YgiN